MLPWSCWGDVSFAVTTASGAGRWGGRCEGEAGKNSRRFPTSARLVRPRPRSAPPRVAPRTPAGALSTFRNRVEAAGKHVVSRGPLFPWKRQHMVHHCTVRSGAVGCRDDGGSWGGTAADLSLCDFLTRPGSLSLLPCSGAAAGIVAAAVQVRRHLWKYPLAPLIPLPPFQRTLWTH